MKIRSAALLTTAILLPAFAAFSAGMASMTVHGKRQTLEQALAWQKSKYDISWYEPLEKESYIVKGFNGYQLHVQLCRCPVPSDKYVILSHGYTDNRFGSLKYMKMYLDEGFNCIIYDLRGHGENEPAPCTYSILESKDLHALIEDTRARFGDQILLGLHGESLGAATTIAALAYDHDLAFAVADCGFCEITNVLKVGLKSMHLPASFLHAASLAARIMYGYSFEQMRPIDALAGNHVPILFIHGAEDQFIVPDNSRKMQEATAGYSRLCLIPKAGHAESVLVNPKLYKEALSEFLAGL